ncbi:SERTA domain-containing protein 2b [Engraulis encrasicolus]|uniref:SERTA domain-containing protein 2b n=1 Tax=Engraulis encrasicolus TaxID=184585 RepID=UPI002FD3351F
MLGKGAKRKLDEDEEGLEGKALAGRHPPTTLLSPPPPPPPPPSSSSTPAGGPGLLPEGLPSSKQAVSSVSVSYTLQRQTIFNISLMKLYSHRSLSEPSLQRRVLINNMLRRIQEELKQEGALRPLLFPSPTLPSAAEHPLDDEGFRQASSSPTPTPLHATVPPASSQNNASLGVLATVSGSVGSGSTLAQGGSSAANGLTVPQQQQQVAAVPPQVCLTPASLLEEDSGAFGALPPPPPAPSLVPPPSSSSPVSSPSSPLLLGAPCRPFRDSFSSALDEIEELCPSSAAAMANGHTTTSLSPSPLSLSSPTSSLSLSLSLSQPLSTSSPSPPHLVPSMALSSSGPEPKDCGPPAPKALKPEPMDTLPPPPPPPSADMDMSSAPSSCNSSPSSCGGHASASAGFLTDLALDDILFADIDTSMYDFDPCTTSGAAGGGGGGVGVGVAVGGASKLTSMVTADDLLKTLSSSATSAVSSSPGGVSIAPSQPFKMDLTELDHIMEVLVGS